MSSKILPSKVHTGLLERQTFEGTAVFCWKPCEAHSLWVMKSLSEPIKNIREAKYKKQADLNLAPFPVVLIRSCR